MDGQLWKSIGREPGVGLFLLHVLVYHALTPLILKEHVIML